MRTLSFILIAVMMSSCVSYLVSGKSGIYVKSTNYVLPYYQTTIIEGNTYTDYRHLAKIILTDSSEKVVKTKADNKGAFALKVKHPGIYTIRAEFTEEVFVEKQIEVKEGELSITIDMIVK